MRSHDTEVGETGSMGHSIRYAPYVHQASDSWDHRPYESPLDTCTYDERISGICDYLGNLSGHCWYCSYEGWPSLILQLQLCFAFQVKWLCIRLSYTVLHTMIYVIFFLERTHGFSITWAYCMFTVSVYQT